MAGRRGACRRLSSAAAAREQGKNGEGGRGDPNPALTLGYWARWRRLRGGQWAAAALMVAARWCSGNGLREARSRCGAVRWWWCRP
jgi:hypothetical protein